MKNGRVTVSSRPKWGLPLLALAVLLSACSSSSSSSRTQDTGSSEVSFEEAHGPDSRFAAVVLGLALVHEADTYGLFFIESPWRVNFSNIDTPSGLSGEALGRRYLESLRSHCPPFNNPLDDYCYTDHQVVQHQVFLVEPGTYIVTRLRQIGAETTFSAPEGTSFDAPSYEEAMASGQIPWFTVEAGETIYIGDFYFDISAQPARLIRMERDDSAAARYLQAYPNFSGQMQFRSPNIFQSEPSS